LAGGLNLYGYANGDPINNSDPFGLSADTTRAPSDTVRREGQQPTVSPFGVPALGYYEKNRELHLGAMVVGRDVTPEANYNWVVGFDGEPGATASLELTRRNTRDASFGRTEHIYSGFLKKGGILYRAQANIYTVAGVTYGFVDVTVP
jgi:hypothetical protein